MKRSNSNTPVHQQINDQSPVLVIGKSVKTVRPLPVHHTRIDECTTGRTILEKLTQVIVHNILGTLLIRLIARTFRIIIIGGSIEHAPIMRECVTE